MFIERSVGDLYGILNTVAESKVARKNKVYAVSRR